MGFTIHAVWTVLFVSTVFCHNDTHLVVTNVDGTSYVDLNENLAFNLSALGLSEVDGTVSRKLDYV